MSTPVSNNVWKQQGTQRLNINSNAFRNGNNVEPRTSSKGVGASVKKKDESPPVTPDSTTEPPPRPAKQFQEGDDVFFHTDDGQHVLGTVGQIVGQTCQVLFGDGTQQWASFKRIKKLSAALDDDNNTSKEEEFVSPKLPNAVVVPKEETTEMFCTMCGVKKKITVSKARTFKPEGPNVFKCRKCTKLPETNSHNHHLSSFLKLPTFKGHSKATSVIANSTSLLQNVNAITIPTASGSLSIIRQKPISTSQDQSMSGVKNKTIPGPSKLTSGACFNCEEDTEINDRVACNMCGRFCHLSCLPLTSPSPPKGDRFWDLMCSSCGTQNSVENPRSRVFSVRRNISSWSDVAYLVLNCITVEKPTQQLFDLDKEILHFLETNMTNLKLPRQYVVPKPEDRKKFILHALYNSRLRFVNGKEYKKRPSLWGLRVDIEQKIKPELLHSDKIKVIDKNGSPPNCNQVFKNPDSAEKPGQMRSSRKQPQPVNRVLSPESPRGIADEPKKTKCDVISIPFGSSSSPTPSMSSLGSTGSIFSLANFVQTSPVISGQYVKQENRNEHEINRKNKKRDHSNSPASLPDKMRKITADGELTVVPSIKKLKLSLSPPKKSSSNHCNQPPKKLSPVKKSGSASPISLKAIHNKSWDTMSNTSSSTSSETVEKTKVIHPTDSNLQKSKRTAIKSSSCVPASALEIKPKLEEEIDVKPKKNEKPTKSKIKELKVRALNRTPNKIAKFKISNRGRPAGIKTGIGKKPPKNTAAASHRQAIKIEPGKPAMSGSGSVVSKQAGGIGNGALETQATRTSKRIMEKNNSIDNRDSITRYLDSKNSSLMDSILYGGYRMQCLPPPPKTKTEERDEWLSVYGHFRTEKQNQTASILLGRSETETRSETRRKSELFGRKTRDLNDFDSYDVVAKKVNEFGITQYFVIWKGDDDDRDEGDEDDDLIMEEDEDVVDVE